MKMYEKLGIDFNTEDGLNKFVRLECENIPDDLIDPNTPCPTEDCWKCKIARLFADVPMKKVKRFERISGEFDLTNFANDYIEDQSIIIGEDNVSIYSIFGFVGFLSEEIEVEDNEDKAVGEI